MSSRHNDLLLGDTAACLCIRGGTSSLFLSRLACLVLNLADMHGIALIQTYIPSQLNVEGDFIFLRRDWFQNGIFFVM